MYKSLYDGNSPPSSCILGLIIFVLENSYHILFGTPRVHLCLMICHLLLLKEPICPRASVSHVGGQVLKWVTATT